MNSDKKLITDSNRLSLFVSNKEKMLRKLQDLASLLNTMEINITYLLHKGCYRESKDIVKWSVSDHPTYDFLPFLQDDEWGDYFVLHLHSKVGDKDIITIALEDDGGSHWFHLQNGHLYVKLAYLVFAMNPKERCQYFVSFDELYNFVERRLSLFATYSSYEIKL